MDDVTSFILDPAAADVEIGSVFSDAMFDDLASHALEGSLFLVALLSCWRDLPQSSVAACGALQLAGAVWTSCERCGTTSSSGGGSCRAFSPISRSGRSGSRRSPTGTQVLA